MKIGTKVYHPDTDIYGEIIESVAGVEAGLDVMGNYCLPVKFTTKDGKIVNRFAYPEKLVEVDE